MGKEKSTTFAITVNDKCKKLFTIKERRSGDLVIALAHAKDYTGSKKIFVSNDTAEPKFSPDIRLIKSQKYSVHMSPKSKDGNLIVQTMEFEEGPDKEVHHFTKAIKVTGNYAPIVSRLYPDLSDSKYDLKDSSSAINIGQYDPKKFVLCTHLFVSSAKNNFISSNLYKTKIFYTNNFCISLCYNFINLPSCFEGNLWHYSTINTQNSYFSSDEKAFFNDLTQGVPAKKSEYYLMKIMDLMAQRHLQNLHDGFQKAEIPQADIDNLMKKTIPNIGFTSVGVV